MECSADVVLSSKQVEEGDFTSNETSKHSKHTKYFSQLCDRFFCVLENFQRIFAILVAPPTVVTMKPLMHCKAHLVI